MSTRSSQTGLSIISMIAILAVLSLVSIGVSRQIRSYLNGLAASRVGQLSAQYNNAVRSWLEANKNVANGTNENGITWLQAATCGGSSSTAYLPCNFPTVPWGGGSYATIFANSGGGNVTATSTIGPIKVDGLARGDLAGLAASTASTYFQPGGGAVSSFGTYSANNPLGTVEAFAMLTAGVNTDPWLRTDGSNMMENNITFDPGAVAANIKNANVVYANALEAIAGANNATYDINGAHFTNGTDTATYGWQAFELADASSRVYSDGTQIAVQSLTGSQGYSRQTPTGFSLIPVAGGGGAYTITANAGALAFQNSVGNQFTFGGAAGSPQATMTVDPNGPVTLDSNTAGTTVAGGNYKFLVNGNLGVNDVYVASRGEWLSALLPHIVFEQSYLVASGQSVQKPGCANGGVALIYLNPYSSNAEYGTFNPGDLYRTNLNYTAVDAGGSWVVNLVSYFEGQPYQTGSEAIAQTYCYYP